MQNLDIPEETLRFYFDSSLGNWVTLGSALYEIQLSGIHFAQLLNQQRLPALHDLLSRILDCPIESLKTVDNLPELLRFLRNYPRIEHYKYACIQVFSDPEACQAEFSQIIEQATALFQKVEAPFLHLIDKAKRLFHSNQHPAFQDMMAHVPQNGELIFIPTLMPLDDIVLNDHNKSPSYLYYGVFFDAFDALVKKILPGHQPLLSRGSKCSPTLGGSTSCWNSKSASLWSRHQRPSEPLPRHRLLPHGQSPLRKLRGGRKARDLHPVFHLPSKPPGLFPVSAKLPAVTVPPNNSNGEDQSQHLHRSPPFLRTHMKNPERKCVRDLERVTRLELATSTLARWRSTG